MGCIYLWNILQAAIKAKLEELGVYVDEELPDYIMVMIANKKEKAQMKEDLLLFLGKNSEKFVDWLVFYCLSSIDCLSLVCIIMWFGSYLILTKYGISTLSQNQCFRLFDIFERLQSASIPNAAQESSDSKRKESESGSHRKELDNSNKREKEKAVDKKKKQESSVSKSALKDHERKEKERQRIKEPERKESEKRIGTAKVVKSKV